MIEEQNNFQETKNPTSFPAGLEDLLRANLAKSEEVLELARQIKSHIRWQVAWSFIRLFVIIIPIILGFIYLPPLLKEFLSTYSFLLPY